MRCVSPLSIKDPSQKLGSIRITVPCGKCGSCMHNRRTEWSFRLKEELRNAHSAKFITLTYSDQNLPWGGYAPTLVKRDIQLFIKRLRKENALVWDKQLRYYAVGEYGTTTRRPHYHILLYNCESSLYSKLDQIWGKGRAQLGEVSDASIHYTTKYHVNYDVTQDAKVLYKEQSIHPEFALMSRRPGIGHAYVGRASSWNYENGYLYVIKDGYKQSMPRYYRKKIFTDDQLKRMAEETISNAQVQYWAEYNRLVKLGVKDPDKYMEDSLYKDSLRVQKKSETNKL